MAKKNKMLKEIQDNLAERMSTHIDSRCATEDEVRIAWLLYYIDELERLINSGKCEKCETNRQHRRNAMKLYESEVLKNFDVVQTNHLLNALLSRVLSSLYGYDKGLHDHYVAMKGNIKNV